MSVRLYVCLSVGGNVIFSAPIYYKALIFCVHITLVYEHLFYKYFVRRSVGRATKGKELRYLWMMSSLFISNNFGKIM